MANVIVIDSDYESDQSIYEVRAPPKILPPLVDIADEINESTMTLNVTRGSTKHEKVKSMPRKAPRGRKNGLLDMNRPVSEVSKLISPSHWTTDMINFYNEDWGDEEMFDVAYFQRQMCKKPHLWQVTEKSAAKRPRCVKCQAFGHVKSQCREKKYVSCFMCGYAGHREKNCPNAVCLRCGRETNRFLNLCRECNLKRYDCCTFCRTVGHSMPECPEHWRKFHSTTTLGPIVNSNYKVNISRLWCCVCGVRGHSFYNCPTSQRSGPVLHSMNVPMHNGQITGGPIIPRTNLRYFNVFLPNLNPNPNSTPNLNSNSNEFAKSFKRNIMKRNDRKNSDKRKKSAKNSEKRKSGAKNRLAKMLNCSDESDEERTKKRPKKWKKFARRTKLSAL